MYKQTQSNRLLALENYDPHCAVCVHCCVRAMSTIWRSTVQQYLGYDISSERRDTARRDATLRQRRRVRDVRVGAAHRHSHRGDYLCRISPLSSHYCLAARDAFASPLLSFSSRLLSSPLLADVSKEPAAAVQQRV